MEEQILVSIIVPVYNIEKYLKRCVDSLIRQTYKNLEIILVDDGSTDSSGFICNACENMDDRVKVIHKINGGLSDARNVGIKAARGEYITCIDGDDFVSPVFLENLWTAVKESGCEIATSWFIDFYEGDKIPEAKKVNIKDIQVLDKQGFYAKLLYQDGVEISAWGKLYKADLFRGVEYPVGKLYEDIPTTYLLVEKTKKIAVIPNVDYFYFQRRTSIAKAAFSLRKMDAIRHMDSFRIFITENYPILKKAAECRYLSTVCNILFQIESNDEKYEKEKKILWEEVKKYRKCVLFDSSARKKARIAALISYGGYGALSFGYNCSKKKGRSRTI